METSLELRRRQVKFVAPHTGAWIETALAGMVKPALKSHPTRVRGLKPYRLLGVNRSSWSHPTRVRGLKHRYATEQTMDAVAPHTGAWIETLDCQTILADHRRTPHGCVD